MVLEDAGSLAALSVFDGVSVFQAEAYHTTEREEVGVVEQGLDHLSKPVLIVR
jgi:hypothetical protein